MTDEKPVNSNGTKINVAPLLTILTIVLSGGSVFGIVHFTISRPLERQVEDLKEMVLRRTTEGLEKTERSEMRLERWIEAEQQRNNLVEQRLASNDAITDMLKEQMFRATKP